MKGKPLWFGVTQTKKKKKKMEEYYIQFLLGYL